MARRRIDLRSIRDRAFALANASCSPSHPLLILRRATENLRSLRWCVESTEPIAVLRRLVAASLRAQLCAEWAVVARQRVVVRGILDPQCSVTSLGASLWAAIDARNAALLGDANCPGALSVLGKLSNAPDLQRRLAAGLRDRRIDVVRGRVLVRLRTHFQTLAILYLGALGWLAFVFLTMPRIREDSGTAIVAATAALAAVTYVFSPVIRKIAEDKRLRDVVNRTPHIVDALEPK